MLILQQFKGHNSCILAAILTKLYMQIYVIVIQIHYEILSLGHLVILNLLILNQYKGNNSCTTNAILTKLDVRQYIMVICIHLKFHQIPLTGYLVMAPDGPEEWTK